MVTKCRTHSRSGALLSLTIVSAMTASLLVFPSSASRRTAPPEAQDLRHTMGQEISPEPSAAVRAKTQAAYGKLDLSFEANHGQTDEQVRFLARGAGYSLFLTNTEAVFVLREPTPHEAEGDAPDGAAGLLQFDRVHERAHVPARQRVLRMRVEGASSQASAQGLEKLPGLVNYFIGDDSAKWRTDIPTFSRVLYTGVYPGVDLVYYGNQQQLEYDFIVNPGADWQQVSLGFEGADAVQIETGTGDLLLKAGSQTVRQRKPFVYQETEGVRREVECGYTLKRDGRVGFHVGEYDRAKPLVIDPVLVYSTYLGGNSNDSGTGIAVDSAGNAYVTGQIASTNFPTANPIQPAVGGDTDAFVTKLNASGSALVYSTYVGGSGSDIGSDIVLDSAANAYVTGETFSTNFPTASPFQAASAGFSDAFMTKVDAAGSALIYSTYLGGLSLDTGKAVAVDSAGNAYVTGQTVSSNFPTANAIDPSFNGIYDVFVTKLNPAGSALIYSTYLGGPNGDSGKGLAVDSAGNAYVAGQTGSPAFPTANPIQPAIGGNFDAFVTKLNAAGSALAYSTFLGGSDSEDGTGIAVDAAGSVYVTGATSSTNFPTANPIQSLSGGSSDAFVTKLNAAGSALAYSTFLGGSGADSGSDIDLDSTGNPYVAGQTFSSNFPTANAIQPLSGGSEDAFVAKFNAAGPALAYSTYLGGSSSDRGKGIAVDHSGNAYVTGETVSANFPTANPIQPASGGNFDAFVARIGNYSIAGRVVNSSASGIAGVTVTLSGSDAAIRTTDADGNFLFLGTTPHGEYTITAFKEGFTFTPPSSFIFDLDGNRDLIFIGSSTTPTPTPTPTPTTTPTPSPTPTATFQFSAASFAANEGAGKFQLIVTRAGDTSQAVAVEYATTDGSANDRGDYTTAVGRLRFQPGDTAKSVDIFITDDVFVEGNETVQITLANPSAGSQLGGMPTALLTIVDDDLAPSAANPIDSPTFFVRQHYVDFLNREPDAAGLNFWADQIISCGADTACIERRRINVSAAFFLSIEFQETGYLVHRLYRVSFNRFPRCREFLGDAQEVGRGVVVGLGAWAAQLESNKQQFTNDFVARVDFLAIYAGLTNEQYVDALNVNTGNSLSASERNALVAGLNGGTETRASTLRKVAEDADFTAREFTKAFVLAQYIGYLRRNPDDAPDSNFDGYTFWLNKLDSFGGDFRAAEMVKAFITSTEYRQRFGQP